MKPLTHTDQCAQVMAQPIAILHVAADYPDCHKPVNTLAVKNFIDRLSAFTNHIVVINRTALPWKCNVVVTGGAGAPGFISIRYWGLPFGILLGFSLYMLARRIRGVVRANGFRFDLIHAHKFAIEGIVAFCLSKWTGAPMVCSMRGEVERKVLRAKPHYAPLYAAIAKHAERLYFVSAWVRRYMRRKIPIEADKERLLPNFVQLTAKPRLKDGATGTFVSVLVLDDKRKGLDKLLPAFRGVVDRYPAATLDLIGRGQPKSLARVRRLLRRYGLSDSVRIIGPLPHRQLVERLPTYSALVLPSRNETFGMAYLEALLSGLPILYSRNTGIDGLLDGVSAAVGVDPFSVSSIRDGMVMLLENADRHHQWLDRHLEELRMRFSPDSYLERYGEDVKLICRRSGSRRRRHPAFQQDFEPHRLGDRQSGARPAREGNP